MTNVFDYIRRQAERLYHQGRVRTSETYIATCHSLHHFLGSGQLSFPQMDAQLMEAYEAWLRQRGLSRNSSSFYLRVLRRIYKMAVEDGLAVGTNPFRMVYTGVDKTARRAIPISRIRAIRDLVLPEGGSLAYARDLFLLSFYLRGMSFVDMAFLRRKDLRHGFVTYKRRKTGQQLSIRWERAMQDIIDRNPSYPTGYLLPIIQREDGSERRQYLNRMLIVNRKLKTIARMTHVATPLTMYVARHSWASIAHSRQIPMSVISEALGHDSEATTRIYLASIQSNMIDDANRRIIQAIIRGVSEH